MSIVQGISHSIGSDIDQKINNLQFTIMPGCSYFLGSSELCDVHNRAYVFWKNFWINVLEMNNSNESLNLDSFYRPYITTLLHNEDEIAGMHMYSAFDLRQISHKEHSYFQLSYPNEFLTSLYESGVESLLTMEFLTVSPNWRKSLIGFSLAEVIMSLGIKIFQSLDIDCFITLARADVKVPDLLRKINFTRYGEMLQRHNTPCEAMLLNRKDVISHPDARIDNLVNKFWNEREDLVGWFHTNRQDDQIVNSGINLKTNEQVRI